MDRTYIDDHHVVARYLAEQLSEADREAFEAYYLEHPEMVQEMEAVARFKLGLAELRDSGELDQLLRPAPSARLPYFAAAACILMVVIGAFFWVGRGAARQPLLVAAASSLTDRTGARLPIAATTYRIQRTRGAYDAEIALPASAAAIALRVLPEMESPLPRYRITLSAVADDDSLREIAIVSGLQPDAQGFVPVFMNSTRLVAGRYQLALFAEDGDKPRDASSVFLIRITPSPETASRD